MKDASLLRLMLVTDGGGDADRTLRVAREAFAGGVRAVQVRERGLADRELLRLLRELRRLLPPGDGLILVNDRVDLCLASGADGAHLGFRSYPAFRAREILGPGRWIGVSVHRPEELRRPDVRAADYAVFGPVFSTPSKAGILKPVGISGLRRAVRVSALPVLGIGGIGPRNAEAAARTGCTGIAAIRSLYESENPRRTARELLRSFGAPDRMTRGVEAQPQ